MAHNTMEAQTATVLLCVTLCPGLPLFSLYLTHYFFFARQLLSLYRFSVAECSRYTAVLLVFF